jgi:MFS family permease
VPLVLLLILLSALPDAMVVPVLRDVLVERYGATAEQSQAFLAINLLGAGLAVPMVRRLRGRVPAWSLVAAGAMADAWLLAIMWLPIGFPATLVVRCIEGVADVLTFAALFQMLGSSAVPRLAWRMGTGATVLIAGLGAGAIVGGVAARASGQGATIIFGLGAGACVLTSMLAVLASRRLEAQEIRLPAASAAPAPDRMPLWPMLLMAAADRATGAALTAVFASFLARNMGYDPAERGRLVGLPLLLMAVGAAPAGWLADRLGPLRTRTFAAIGYAACFAAVAWAGASTAVLSGVLLVLGLTAAPLLPASLSLTVRCGHESAGLAAFRAAGDAGYFAGIVTVVAVGTWLGGDRLVTQQWLMTGFAAVHAAVTVLAWRRLRSGAAGVSFG